LDALPPESTAGLLNTLLGDDPGLAPLKQLLVKRGNPFFVEESVRTLVETRALVGEQGKYRLAQPISSIQIPQTVQTTLAARIDRLPPEEKRLLQIASVVGKDVPLRILERVADMPLETLEQALDHLQSAELVYEIELYPDPEYSFKHALTHEVTYGGLLQERRRELHAGIVDAIEALHADRLTEHVERLAHHAHRGALGEKAVHYLRQAGLKAAARSGLRDARIYFEQALDVLALLPETQSTLENSFEIRLDLRGVLSLVEEGRLVVDLLREAERIAEKLNDLERGGRVSVFLANAEVLVGKLDDAIVRLTSALDYAQRRGDLKLRILALGFLAWAHRERGDHEHVVVLTKQSLAALPQDWKYDFLGRTVPASVYDRYNLSLSLSALGRFTEATEYALEGIRIAETLENPNTMTMAYYAAGLSHVGRGQWEDGFHWSERALRVSQAGNIVQMLPSLLASLAGSLARLGNAREASERVRESERYLDEIATRGSVFLAGSVYGQLGRACLLLGWADEARRLGLRALECSANLAGYAATAHHLLGDVARESDGFDAVSCEEHYRKALSLAEPRGMRPLVAHCHLGLGKLYQRTGKREHAQEHLTTATTMYREMDMRFWLEQAETEMHGST
jgi:tetratricopeptide (TPR) repeat protein